ncbi:MAG: FAD:protein FMN transferase [Desulfosalsimonas sp.]|uniref:FAD:protein FMN transferase n=1 Tax=Desulfosalsimonas sp. TaxID=3073848 RepID=UPI003970F216
MKTSRNSLLLGIIAAIPGLAILAALFFLPLTQPNAQNDPENDPGQKADVSLTRPEPDWWESRRLIYYDIPARVLFYLPDGSRRDAEAVARAVWNEFERIGRIFNPSDPQSEVSRLNTADKTAPVAVSNEMHAVFRISKRLWDASSGAFDPSTALLKKLWQNAVKTQKIPSSRDIQRILACTGFDKVTIMDNPPAVMCSAGGMKFDFGGIAKGFALDQSRGVLRKSGIHMGMVQLGGEVAAFGSRPRRPWRIGIQHPRDMEKIWKTISSSADIRVSTSGNYRQPLVIQDHTFYHIFSPKTGRPVSEKIAGVTTADFGGRSSALLDGAATAITVLGTEKGMQLAEKLSIEALVLSIDSKEQIQEQFTPNLPDNMDTKSKSRQ